MSRILRRLELVADDWVALGSPAAAASSDGAVEAAPADGASVIVPFAKFRENSQAWRTRKGQLGVRLAPADQVEELAADVPHLALIALEFTGPGEGRGYTQAKLLRHRYKFRGELRAVGHVKQDQLYLMTRCGIDSFELSPTEKPEEALATFERFRVAYAPGAPLRSLSRERFHSRRS